MCRKIKAINNAEGLLDLLGEALELASRHPKEASNLAMDAVDRAEVLEFIVREDQ